MSTPLPPAKLSIISRVKSVVLGKPLWLAGGLIICGGVIFALTLWGSGTRSESAEGLVAQALQHLGSGNYEESRKLAEALSKKRGLSDDQRGLLAYVLGVTLVRLECERERRADRRAGMYMVAARYFEEASLQGVPPEYQGSVDYWNGRSLILAQQQALARGPLERALTSNSQHRKEILMWLGQAYMADEKLAKTKGLEYMDQLLAEPDLDSLTQNQAISLKARLLLAEDQLDLALPLWESLPKDAANRLELQIALAKYYLRLAKRQRQIRASEAEIQATYQQAIQVLSDQAGAATADSDMDRGQFAYLLGQAQKGAGQFDDALENFTFVRRQYFDHPMGIAAGFWEAQTQLEADDLPGAYRLFSSLLRETVRPNNQGETEWLNQETISEMVTSAVERFIRSGDCLTAVKLADEFRVASTSRTPPIPLGNAAQLRVTALQRWIELLENRLSEANYAERLDLESLLREKYLDYAHSLYSLAVNRYASEHYTTDLYQAGEYFYRGGDYQRAVLTFQQYLDANEPRFAAQSRLRVGQSQLALRSYAAAAESLSNCWILFPNDPVVYQARYGAAECYLELGKPQVAEEMLRANLENDKLTPSSQEWIESLFLLGNLLFDQGKILEARSDLATVPDNANNEEDPTTLMEQAAQYYALAINRLSEAVQRAPQSPSALESLYRLAEAYRRHNRWHEVQISMTTISSHRAQINELVRRYDEQAVRLLTQLEGRLLELREKQPLDEIQEKLLRNSYFKRGLLYQRLGQYEPAIQVYRTVSNMVIQEPEVLEAYTQIASCYRRLSRHDEAVRVINQAKIILRDRIPADADFEAKTRFPRDRWIAMLDWLATI